MYAMKYHPFKISVFFLGITNRNMSIQNIKVFSVMHMVFEYHYFEIATLAF